MVASAERPNSRLRPRGYLDPVGAQINPCSYAKAVAAARDETRHLSKMLLTCLSTVRLLTTSSAAIALLLRPAATSRSTWSSRWVKPPVAPSSRAAPSCVEHCARSVALERRGLVVAERAASLGDQEAGACVLVRRLELLPELPRLPEIVHGAAGVAVCELDGAACLRRLRLQHRAAVARRDPVELGRHRARLLAVSGGEHDLDRGRQKPRPLHPSGRRGEHLLDRRGRGFGPPLRQPQQSEAGLRLAPAPACGAIRLFGAGQVALQAQDLALPIERLACTSVVRALGESLACDPRLFERDAPFAAQLHELRTVH